MRAAAVAVAAFLAGAGPLAGQEPGPTILRVPASPRAFGFADAWVGGTGVEAAFHNPAQVGRTHGLLASAARYAGAATQAGLASSTGLGRFAVAVTARWLDYGTTGPGPVRPGGLTERGPANGQSLAAGAALSTTVRGVRVGLGAQYVEERGPAVRGGVTAFTLGVAKDFSRVTVGLTARDFGPDLEVAQVEHPLPSRITAGANLRRTAIGTFFDLTAGAAVSRERDGRIVPAGGVELLYEPLGGHTIAVRVGARRVDGAGRPGLQPITVGGSLGLDRFSLDYGFESYRGTGAVHRFGIRIE